MKPKLPRWLKTNKIPPKPIVVSIPEDNAERIYSYEGLQLAATLAIHAQLNMQMTYDKSIKCATGYVRDIINYPATSNTLDNFFYDFESWVRRQTTNDPFSARSNERYKIND